MWVLTTRRLHWRTNHSFALLGCRPTVAGSRGGGNLAAAAASESVSRNPQFGSLWVGEKEADKGHGLKVDCYPWGEDAFTKAQAEYKSIFLSGVFLFAVCITIGWVSLIFKWIIAPVT
ncbi:unnamed protein product, partial [Sphagnum compactum]